MNEVLLSTAAQKIWDFLCRNPGEEFYSAQIANQAFLSKGGTNQILRAMAKQGLLLTGKKGRMIFYRVDTRSAVIRQFKVLRNVTSAEAMIQKVKPLAEKIVLFGSCASGEDTPESDLDVLVVSRDKEKCRTLMPDYQDQRKVQVVMKTPQEYIALEKKDPVFFQELNKGVVLWEKM